MSFWKWLFGKGQTQNRGVEVPPEFPLTPASENPWGVDVVDVTPHTLTTVSVTRDRKQAENAVSFRRTEDGLEFQGREPESDRKVEVHLEYPCASTLFDGPVHLPQQMEEKWALFYFQARLILVSSWLREVRLVAETEVDGDRLIVGSTRGNIVGEPEEYTGALLDFVIRSHALAEVWPVLAPPEMMEEPEQLARWCFHCFGSRAHLACGSPPNFVAPSLLFRTYSPLHTACARGELEDMSRLVAEGVDPNVLGADQFPPLQWTLSHPDTSVTEHLLQLGADVEGADPDGYTALMGCVTSRNPRYLEVLLAAGACPNAVTSDGFTALHIAAERGLVSAVRRLLEAGADPGKVARGYTALELAELRGETEVVELLRG